MTPTAGRPADRIGRAAGLVVAVAGIIAALYIGQALLIPIALSILLAFVLTPVVRALQRWRIPKLPAVLLLGVVIYGGVGGIGWVLVAQAAALARELPQHRERIKQKIADVRGLARGGLLEELQTTLQEAAEEDAPEVARRSQEREAVPVTVQEDAGARLWALPIALGPWLSPLASVVLVALLVPFMLLERQTLPARLIRLLGRGRLAMTMKAMEEAGERISRYLIMHTLINASYGVMAAAGLLLIGVPYALLWGFLAAVLRFIPYVGPWIAAALPVLLSVAAFEGWTTFFLVIGLFVALELFSNMVLETVLYAGSVGLSQVALIIAIAFWTLLWGPIGLVLATPLTVCLVVLGKYVPELHFMAVLMGGDPVVTPDLEFYQRLLAGDDDEMLEVVERFLAQQPPERVYDDVLLPALIHVAHDRAAGAIDAAEEERLHARVRGTLEGLDDLLGADDAGSVVPETPGGRTLLACPARGAADALALVMLERLLRPAGLAVEVVGEDVLSSEVAAHAAEQVPAAVVIAALPPGGLAEARYLCKRLRARTSTPLLVGRWGEPGPLDDARRALLPLGVVAVTASLIATRDALQSLRHLAPAPAPQTARAATGESEAGADAARPAQPPELGGTSRAA